MDMSQELVAANINAAILQWVRIEKEELREAHQKDIFDIPELALVYQVGKHISANKKDILTSADHEWVRETDFGNGGPTDLAFISKDGNTSYALEFKMDDTWMKYLADMRKLVSLKSDMHNFQKFFVAFKWVFDDDHSEFINELERGGKADGIFEKVTLLHEDTFDVLRQSTGGHQDGCWYSFWLVD